MTRKDNLRFIAGGFGLLALAGAATGVHAATGSPLAFALAAPLGFLAIGALLLLGVMPWCLALGLKHPIHDTQGYRPDFAPEPEKERGGYATQGWRRKHERLSMRIGTASMLAIEEGRTT